MNGSEVETCNTNQGLEERLTSILESLVTELRGRKNTIRLDSHLDRDLGLDSLARVELTLRLEKAFDIRLPETTLVEAETPRDLLAAIATAEGTAISNNWLARIGADEIVAHVPAGAQTLVNVLEWHAQHTPERIHVYFYSDESVTPITYGDLHQDAKRVAAGLRALGLGPGQAVALMLPTGRGFLGAFFGALMAGAVVAPLYPPVRRSALEDHARRQAAILNNCQAPIFITSAEVRALSPLLKGLAPQLRAVVTPDELGGEKVYERPACAGHHLALLQYTSGSTGDPKGVMLTHENLLANVRAMGSAVAVRPEKDVFVSWLPLYHDMGLIGAWLGSLYYGMPLVLMSPLTFLARPQRWLRAIHRHRGTLSAGPNFAYELCATKIGDEELSGLDLSSWRVAFNGAEQVSAETMRRFSTRFAAHGFRSDVMTPVYGLAESSVGLAFPPLERGPLIDCVDRETFMRDGVAAPTRLTTDAALCFVGCGRALPGHELRVVDARGHVCDERREGRVQFRGPSSCQGYLNNPEATARLIQGEWLDSGDRGYLVSGEIFITGRVKDIIIRAGHNIYPYELEEAVGKIAGIRQGGVAAFASRDQTAGTERLVIVAETRERRPHVRERLSASVNEAVTAVIGNPPDQVVLASPRAVLKTSSGKVRRDATRQRYERGALEEVSLPLWRQGLRLAMEGAGTWLHRGVAAAAAWLYGSYAWAVFLCGAIAAVAGIGLLPTLSARQTWCRAVARVTASAAGLRLKVKGMQHFNGGDTRIVVANHASYLDAMVLVAVLPIGLSYVTKRELASQPVVGWCLRRIGCEFVERFDLQQSAAAARGMEERARAGASLVFFPEGTFGPAPGLRPFRMGAFLTAARAGMVVVPIALTGTRAILPSGAWRPRRGKVIIDIGAPLSADDDGWRAAVALRDHVRARIAHVIGEPELQQL